MPDMQVRRELLLAGIGVARLCMRVAPARTSVIALLDGPVDTSHPALAGLRVIEHRAGAASDHATAMASLLAGPTFCPPAAIALHCWPTLDDHALATTLPAQARQLTADLGHACAQRPDAIVLGFEFASRAPLFVEPVAHALGAALAAGIPVIVPGGNRVGADCHPLLSHPAVLPATMTDRAGAPGKGSAWGPAVARRGLRAPGQDVPVALTGNRMGLASGTSFAAALVALAFAALRARLAAPAPTIWAALRASAPGAPRPGTSLAEPPPVDAWRAYQSFGVTVPKEPVHA
jgi:subtilisin family serine protease